MKKKHLIYIFLFLSGSTQYSWGQKKDTFQKQQEAFEKAFEQQSAVFNKTKTEQEQLFRKYKEKLDKAFGDYLEKSWAKVKDGNITEKKATPKPIETPVAREKQTEEATKITHVEVIQPNKENLPAQNKQTIPSILKIPVKPQKTNEKESLLTVDYFDAKIDLPYRESFSIDLPGQMNKQAIAHYWKSMTSKDYLYFLQQIIRRRAKMHLNDWAYYHLLKNTGEKITGGDANETRLFVWFMLLQSGYKAKVGYEDNKVYLLLPAGSIIYRNTYYKMDDLYYYVIDAPRQSMALEVYKEDYPDAKNIIRLDIPKDLKITEELTYREIKFDHKFQKYTVKVAYNPQVINLFEHYPLTDLRVFFEAPPTEVAASSLREALEPLLKDKTEEQAVNLLLRFVQKGFAYKTDQEQFGREKTFFVEETLHYPYADCEDRSVLFAYLVRELIGLKTVGLDYPGHIATAVKFNDTVEGDYCMVEGEKYIICDPTYMGASCGQAMDVYKQAKAEIISLK